MATVNFLYRSAKDKANLHLRLLYRFNDADFVFGANTKYEVLKDYWKENHVIDKKTKKIKGTKEVDIVNKRLEVNNELNKIENHILNAFNSVNPDEISKEWLQTQMDYYYNPPQEAEQLPRELLKYIDYYIDIKRNEVSIGTIKKCNVIKQLLIRHQIHVKKTFLITDIDAQFKIGFEKYCLSKQYAPNTIARAVKFVKTICKHARSNGLEISYQLDNIKTKFQKVESVYLTFDELEKIEKIKKNKLTENLDTAKDWLIISCYTGQRISDFMRFDKSMIRYEKNKEGILKPLIEFTQVKTNKVMTVALHPKVIEILEKRNGDFPRPISDPKYNLFIKQVCSIAGITNVIKGSKLVDINKEDKVEKKTKSKDEVRQYRKEVGMFKKCELVTSHIGRRSFATNFYGIIPTTHLINVTGHSTEAMFLNYLGKSNKDLAMELTNYF